MTKTGRKRVLIITYYWPPSGGAGVQRWLKFSKYLRDFDFEPVIYTVENPEYPSLDESLIKDVPEGIEVLKTPAWEPYRLYKWFTFQKKGHRVNAGFLNQEKKKGFGEKISVWIRGNLFIPDARKFWIKPSIKYLIRYLRENPADIIASTGPPHSMHLIGLGVSQSTGIPWLADFRDPWTRIDFYQELMLNHFADRKHKRLEQEVLKNAGIVTVNSHDMKRVFSEEMGFDNIHVVPNGFDPEDFSGPVVRKGKVSHSSQENPEGLSSGPAGSRKFSLIHIGTVVPSRNPATLWKVLAELVSADERFSNDMEVILVGAIDYSVRKSVQDAGLDKWIRHIDYLPHKEATGMLKKSQVLLLLINNTAFAKGVQPGKLFEYMCAGRPILTIGPPDGETACFLKDTNTGVIADFDDYQEIKKLVSEYYAEYREGDLTVEANEIERYSRKTLTGKMAELFTKLTETK